MPHTGSQLLTITKPHSRTTDQRHTKSPTPTKIMTTKTDRANSKLMLDAGYSIEQVAAYFGVKPDTCRSWHDPSFRAQQVKKYSARNFRKSRGWS